MSGYYDDEPPRRHRTHRESRRPVYEEEEVIQSHTRNGRPTRQMDLIRRPRDDSASSIEEVSRDFPPGGGAYVKRRTTTRDAYPPARARSADRSRYYDDYYGGDPRRSEGAIGGRSRRSDARGQISSDGSVVPVLLTYADTI